MVHTKFGDIYLANYISRQKTIRKWFKIFTLVFSASGVLGWKIWEYVPVFACGIIAVMQIVLLLENQIISSDQDIESIAGLRNMYISYFNKLEKLWTDFNSNKLTELQATDHFYKLRQLGADIEAADNKLHIPKLKHICAKTDTETRNYFTQFHS